MSNVLLRWFFALLSCPYVVDNTRSETSDFYVLRSDHLKNKFFFFQTCRLDRIRSPPVENRCRARKRNETGPVRVNDNRVLYGDCCYWPLCVLSYRRRVRIDTVRNLNLLGKQQYTYCVSKNIPTRPRARGTYK